MRAFESRRLAGRIVLHVGNAKLIYDTMQKSERRTKEDVPCNLYISM